MMNPGDVSSVVATIVGGGITGWFLCTHDNVGVCIYPVTDDPNKGWTEKWRDDNGKEGFWNLVCMDPVPPEEWPPEVCAAVAKWRLTQ
jgi:hypothetical protein